MRLVILHLSDIHVNSADDGILARAGKIADAIRVRLADATECAIAISGDVAYAGLEAQYYLAVGFIADLTAQIGTYLGGEEHLHIVMIPGNHDCDLSHGGEARNLIVAPVRDRVDESIIQIATGVQGAFFELLDVVAQPDRRFGCGSFRTNHYPLLTIG